tara:strand:+ start:523 stop:726 length:204 start_codon:yes stop_codon:yes gene_type:complete
MKFEITEQNDNKLVIEYDDVFEDTVCALMGWDELTEFRLQYFVNETMYDYVKKSGKLKKSNRIRRKK